jgi:hypothetical protein
MPFVNSDNQRMRSIWPIIVLLTKSPQKNINRTDFNADLKNNVESKI